jgi:hypothetical protein
MSFISFTSSCWNSSASFFLGCSVESRAGKTKNPEGRHSSGAVGVVYWLKQKDQISSLPPNPNGPEEEA